MIGLAASSWNVVIDGKICIKVSKKIYITGCNVKNLRQLRGSSYRQILPRGEKGGIYKYKLTQDLKDYFTFLAFGLGLLCNIFAHFGICRSAAA